ncbi:MAG: nucleotidyltransferase domain-containing protein [Ktedonobacteraceae bacterium]
MANTKRKNIDAISLELGSEVVSTLLAEFDDPDAFVGAMLVGSAARGDMSKYSDVDLIFFSRMNPDDDRTKYKLEYRNNCLISLSVRSLSASQAALSSPVEAISVVQGLREGVILRDSDAGALADLQAAADQFMWTPELTAEANRLASYYLMGNAEEVHKVLRGLLENEDIALLNGTWGLATTMPLVVALRYGILSRGDNLFRAQVCQVVGVDSPWAQYHAIAIGSSPGPSGFSQLSQQAVGAFWLFEETVHQCSGSLLHEDRQVAHLAITTAYASGLIPSKEAL